MEPNEHSRQSLHQLPQFGKLIGRWRIEQEVLQRDGTWLRIDDAEWTFEYILNGSAIQDYWVQPGFFSTEKESVNRQYGTNIRIYDSESDTWKVAWTSNDEKGFSLFEAAQLPNGNLLMQDVALTEGDFKQRFTYFSIEQDKWSWKMELETKPSIWTVVSRITAYRASSD